MGLIRALCAILLLGCAACGDHRDLAYNITLSQKPTIIAPWRSLDVPGPDHRLCLELIDRGDRIRGSGDDGIERQQIIEEPELWIVTRDGRRIDIGAALVATNGSRREIKPNYGRNGGRFASADPLGSTSYPGWLCFYLKRSVVGSAPVARVELWATSDLRVNKVDWFSGEYRSPDPCFIATAAFGSPLHPKVQALRNFRDVWLMQSQFGRSIVRLYVHWSPPLAQFISRHDTARWIARVLLMPVFAIVLYPIPTALLMLLVLVWSGHHMLVVVRTRRE